MIYFNLKHLKWSNNIFLLLERKRVQKIKIKYLDLSKFNTLNVETIGNMFESCSELIFLNLYSFIFNSPKYKDHAFDGVPSTTKYCINDINTKNYILDSSKVSDCNDICFKENIIVDIINNECIEAWSLDEYKFKYDNKCYIECPKNKFALYCEEEECEYGKRECYDHIIQGYYLNITNNVFY